MKAVAPLVFISKKYEVQMQNLLLSVDRLSTFIGKAFAWAAIVLTAILIGYAKGWKEGTQHGFRRGLIRATK